MTSEHVTRSNAPSLSLYVSSKSRAVAGDLELGEQFLDYLEPWVYRRYLGLADITGIKASITRYAAARIGPNYPVSIENAKFSMPYLAAYTLLHGAPKLAAFSEEAIHDERVRAAARLVSIAIDPEFAEIYEESPSRIIVSFRDGSTVEKLRYYASGTLQFPLTPAQIHEKFMDCAPRAVGPDAATKLFAGLQRLNEATSLDLMWPLLRRG